MPTLLTIQGPLVGSRFVLKEAVTLGRSPGATIVLPDPQVSRLHAVIRFEDPGISITDGSSRNGTLVNGERLTGTRTLNPGDAVQVGSSRFLVDVPEQMIPCRYAQTWLILGGSCQAPVMEDSPDAQDDTTRSDVLDPGAGLNPLGEILSTGGSQEVLARQLLQFWMDAVGASRGILVELYPDGSGTPLIAIAPQPPQTLPPTLYQQVVSGKNVAFQGTVEGVRFQQGVRSVETREVTILAIGWKAGGFPAGCVWLERDLDAGPFDPDATAALYTSVLLAGPALDMARHQRQTAFRSAADGARVERERVSAEDILRHSGLWEVACQMASTARPVAILGPQGVGKDRVARCIHQRSHRREGPLVTVNCATLSAAQVTLELFGAEKETLPCFEGPYKGALERAEGGTVVLELIDALQTSVQQLLVAALTGRRIFRRGGYTAVPIDVRLVCTSAQPLDHWVAENRLRADLVPLVAATSLTLPGLDVLKPHLIALTLQMVGRLNVRLARQVKGISSGAERALLSREWTLNLWELEDLITRAIAICDGDLIRREDLEAAEVMSSDSGTGESAIGSRHSSTLRDVERRLLVQALRIAGGRRREAAELLGVSREDLELKILEYALNPARW